MADGSLAILNVSPWTIYHREGGAWVATPNVLTKDPTALAVGADIPIVSYASIPGAPPASAAPANSLLVAVDNSVANLIRVCEEQALAWAWAGASMTYDGT